MRAAIAAAIIGVVLVAAAGSQAAARPSESLDRPSSRTAGSAWSSSCRRVRDLRRQGEPAPVVVERARRATLAKVRARADVRGTEASTAADRPSNNRAAVGGFRCPSQIGSPTSA